jgi:hypothetical protein
MKREPGTGKKPRAPKVGPTGPTARLHDPQEFDSTTCRSAHSGKPQPLTLHRSATLGLNSSIFWATSDQLSDSSCSASSERGSPRCILVW